jgi:GNAT superfamily N-acetyltransferase
MIIVRIARCSDAEQLMTLLKTLGYPMSKELLEEKISLYTNVPDYGLLVAEESGNIVGFIAFVLCDLFVLPGKRCRIEALCVDAALRKQGIGRKLIAEVEAEAKQKGCILLELTSGMRRAIEGTHDFYRALGFHNDGPDAKLYLRKKLTQ